MTARQARYAYSAEYWYHTEAALQIKRDPYSYLRYLAFAFVCLIMSFCSLFVPPSFDGTRSATLLLSIVALVVDAGAVSARLPPVGHRIWLVDFLSGLMYIQVTLANPTLS